MDDGCDDDNNCDDDDDSVVVCPVGTWSGPVAPLIVTAPPGVTRVCGAANPPWLSGTDGPAVDAAPLNVSSTAQSETIETAVDRTMRRYIIIIVVVGGGGGGGS